MAAYASRNAISPTGLTEMLASVYAALHQLGASAAAPRPERPKPFVPINKTITSGQLISLEDGKPYRSLKRHLGVRGLTPEEYRSKWGLPANYPMIGLGRKLAAPPEPKKHARQPRN